MQIASALRPAVTVFAALTLLTGIAYPFLVDGIGRVAFARSAAGSLVERDGKVVGSSLIGQTSSDPKHFWARPSATSPQANNASASGGSNLGPLNPALIDAVKGRVDALKAANKDAGVEDIAPIPVDLVTTSASGLDPHISPEAAAWQAPRVAEASGVPLERVKTLVAASTEPPQLGFLGMARVNVLELNLALDGEHGNPQ